MSPDGNSTGEIERAYAALKREAEAGGYFLNPDGDFTRALIAGLLKNERRYGYRSCPCRLASGKRDEDRDIICPCDYRDPDLDESGACYCALYVSPAIAAGQKTVVPVPERRPPKSLRGRQPPASPAPAGPVFSVPIPVWRCRVCGYLCARDQPPAICPICKATKDRFERFL